MYTHTPVLLAEVLKILNPQPNSNFVDSTLGGGGYTKALLDAVSPNGKVLALDADQEAINNAKEQLNKYKNQLILDHRNFRDLEDSIKKHDISSISGIVADIGISSYQLDQSGRGISFQSDAPLDMRFDLSSNDPDASFLLNHHDQAELTQLFRDYGEEKHSLAIAKKVLAYRENKQIKRTVELVEIIKDALPKPVKHRWEDSARRIFQALRIAVNHELDSLERFLPQALDLVMPGGVVVVVTFHSLEDRIVKNFFKDAATGCVCPPEFPICKCGRTPRAEILTKKPITASDSELSVNPRAKSAKLRAIKKI